MRGVADAVRGSEHLQPQRRLFGGRNGASENVKAVGSSLLQRAQGSRGDEDRNRKQVVFGLAVAGDDAAVLGGESRTVCGVE